MDTGEGGGDKHFCIKRGGVQPFFVGGCGGYDDVYEEIDVSEASQLSAGARNFINKNSVRYDAFCFKNKNDITCVFSNISLFNHEFIIIFLCNNFVIS